MIVRSLKRLFHQITISDQSYRFMFEPGPEDEVVAIDCETTGLDTRRDDIITIAAVKIRGNLILTSERFEVIARPEVKMQADAIKVHQLFEADVEDQKRLYPALSHLLHFIEGRPLVGYYLEFDVRMLNKHILPFVSIELPNPRLEVSQMYYERKYGDAPPGTQIDLSFSSILKDLRIPELPAHDAFNDALMTAMIYVTLRDLKKRGVRIPRPRAGSVYNPTG